MNLVCADAFHRLIEGLNAREITARGNAPGGRAIGFRAPKGRHNISFDPGARICSALSGLNLLHDIKPGASPRAVICRPYRAGEGMVWA